MSQTIFIVTVAGVMVFAGCLGGLANFFSAGKDDLEETSFWRSITLGVVASLLVPLFLNMISSSLLDSIRNGSSGSPDFPKILVFSGFCLVAAISSSTFIKTISDRVLKEAKEAKKVAHQADKKATEAQSAIQPIVEKETESDPPTDASEAIAASAQTLDGNEKKLLQNLATGRWVLRTRTGLAKETGIAKSIVDRMMDELKKRELVDYKWIAGKLGEKKKRWYITNKGREAVPLR